MSHVSGVAVSLIDKMQEGPMRHYLHESLRDDAAPQFMVQMFHRLYGMPVKARFEPMPISRMDFRLALVFEEMAELIEACGFKMEADEEEPGLSNGRIAVEHIEGVPANYIEIMDALADIVYVCYGFAAELGLPLQVALQEVHASNLTKLGEDGLPIINKCVNTRDHLDGQPDPDCHMPHHRINPNLPVGKVLKGRNYVKAQLAAVLAPYMETES
jgi:predicted HAD superfamily Cof-like phosphohydrolase